MEEMKATLLHYRNEGDMIVYFQCEWNKYANIVRPFLEKFITKQYYVHDIS